MHSEIQRNSAEDNNYKQRKKMKKNYKKSLKSFVEEVNNYNEGGQLSNYNSYLPWDGWFWQQGGDDDVTVFLTTGEKGYEVHYLEGHKSVSFIKKDCPFYKELVSYCHTTVDRYTVAALHVIEGWYFQSFYSTQVSIHCFRWFMPEDTVKEVEAMYGETPKQVSTTECEQILEQCKECKSLYNIDFDNGEDVLAQLENGENIPIAIAYGEDFARAYVGSHMFHTANIRDYANSRDLNYVESAINGDTYDKLVKLANERKALNHYRGMCPRIFKW